jgi:hypothetical protein
MKGVLRPSIWLNVQELGFGHWSERSRVGLFPLSNLPFSGAGETSTCYGSGMKASMMEV